LELDGKIDRLYGNRFVKKNQIDKNVPLKFKANVRIKSTQRKVLNLIINNQDITREEIARILKISIRTVGRNIKNLKEKGIIERIGSRKMGYWNINKNQIELKNVPLNVPIKKYI